MPRAKELGVPDAEEPNVLEVAGREAKAFLRKTAESLLKWGVTRIIDLIAPGVGAAITTLEHIVSVAQDIKALDKGSGEIGFPIGIFDGFEFRAEIHVGDDSEGRNLPFSAFIAPCEGDSLLDQVDIRPDNDHRYAAVVAADLSKLSELPEPACRAGVIRSYTEQGLLPELRHDEYKEVELVYVHDEKTGTGAWVRVSGCRTSWCIFIWRSSDN